MYFAAEPGTRFRRVSTSAKNSMGIVLRRSCPHPRLYDGDDVIGVADEFGSGFCGNLRA